MRMATRARLKRNMISEVFARCFAPRVLLRLDILFISGNIVSVSGFSVGNTARKAETPKHCIQYPFIFIYKEDEVMDINQVGHLYIT